MTVTITNVPGTSPPNKYGGDPVAFDAAMQAHLEWQTSAIPQLNAQNIENNSINTLAAAAQASASASAAAALVSAALAASATGATKWVTGTTYAIGDVRYSTVNNRTYRRTTAGAGTTDPSSDPTNWFLLSPDTSLIAAASKIPLADSSGLLDASWLAAISGVKINDIGVANTPGAGVGICPAVPAGYTPLPGCTDKLSANYGNYQYSDGSIEVWIPAFWIRRGHASNPTYANYGVNSISIVPIWTYPDDVTANVEGFYRHRAFVNAGANQLGFFRDKYDCSLNGTIASSIALAMPMVSGPNLVGTPLVGFTGATARSQTPTNTYSGSLQAAKSRSAKHFPESVFIASALSDISDWIAQAATSTAYCAWFDATGVRNYPKGNDNNALKSEADVLQNGAGAVTFTSAGITTYPNFALTGSGSNLAKTTHNGQACGVADVAGNIYKINPGLTCIATSKNISGANQANPCSITVAAHGRTTGDYVQIDSVVGMTQLNGKIYVCTVVDANTITLDGVDSRAFTAYTSSGTVISGTFYILKNSVDIAAVTSGTTLATDHWGATGVAAQFDAVALNFATTYPNNGYVQRYGNAVNAVFDMSTTNGRALAFAGLPAAGGMSTSGSNAMGADYYYQYMRDQLCVRSRGGWSNGSNAGGRGRSLDSSRTGDSNGVGFACTSYL